VGNVAKWAAVMTVFFCDFAAFSLFRRLLWRLAQLDAFQELTLAFNRLKNIF